MSIAFGAGAGLLFVYTSDLPEIHALEDYRPDTVTELYADDGQSIGTFALQRRILLTYEQIPKVLKDAIIATEDQHFEQHWGVDFTRVVGAAWRDIAKRKISEGASTITMQLAGGFFSIARIAPSVGKARKRCSLSRLSGTTPSSKS